MEIERKWLVTGWPDKQPAPPVVDVQEMRQGYISVEPTVRIREERNILRAEGSAASVYILCFKSRGGIAREEIEFPVTEENFRKLEKLIGLPLIPKTRKTYLLADGSRLEVNQVDAGTDTEFWYAEIEYDSLEKARTWTPQETWLTAYLSNEVTETPGYSMGAYWVKTRIRR